MQINNDVFVKLLANNPLHNAGYIFKIPTCAKSLQLCPTLQAHGLLLLQQAPLSMGFTRQEYWSGLPRPSPGDLPDPGIKPESPISPALAGGFFTTSAT